MQTVMIRVVVLSYLLLSGLCALPHAAEQTITRTVEDFTLGMPKDQAFAVLLFGLKQHHLTLEDQAQTPSQELMERLEHNPMEAVGPPWIAPQSSDIIYTINALLFDATINALLFDAQEFKDPVVNIAIAAQVEQSLSWSSPTAQSMYVPKHKFFHSPLLAVHGRGAGKCEITFVQVLIWSCIKPTCSASLSCLVPPTRP